MLRFDRHPEEFLRAEAVWPTPPACSNGIP